MGEQEDHDKLVRLEIQAEQDRKNREETNETLREIAKRLDQATKARPVIDVHDGSIHAACPNCSTEAIAPLPVAAGPVMESFDDVVRLLDSPHREAQGKKVNECPGCKPKFEAKLKELGYGPLAPVEAPAE